MGGKVEELWREGFVERRGGRRIKGQEVDTEGRKVGEGGKEDGHPQFLRCECAHSTEDHNHTTT